MVKSLTKTLLFALIVMSGAPFLKSQDDSGTIYRVDVNMVVLTFSVTDKKGNPVSGLRPEDIRIARTASSKRSHRLQKEAS